MILYSLPFIAAIIGWFTNFLAVKMLFRPRRPVKLLFFTVQGIFPKRQAVLAEKIGKMVADELLSTNDISDKLKSPEILASINEGIAAKIDDFLNISFPEKYPLIAMFVKEKARQKIKNDIMEEVENTTPELISGFMSKLESEFDIEETIRQRVAILSPIKLENLINSILKKEFGFIELVGAILGFLIGLIQVILMQLSA